MRRLFAIYYFYAAILVLVILIANQAFTLSSYPLVLGVCLGILLPDIDSLIYIYLSRPQELSSQRTKRAVSQKEYSKALQLIFMSRDERKELIFHNVMFQVLFVAFAYLIVSSTVSLFGVGLVLAFLLHLIIDQGIDFIDKDTIDHWFSRLTFSLGKQQQALYWVANIFILVFLSLFF